MFVTIRGRALEFRSPLVPSWNRDDFGWWQWPFQTYRWVDLASSLPTLIADAQRLRDIPGVWQRTTSTDE